MKSKFFKKPDPDQENEKETQEDADVSSEGPSIAAAKKGKLLIIVASTLLVTGVIYFLFFKTDVKPQDKLEEVSVSTAPTRDSSVARSDGKSLYEIEKKEERPKQDVDLLEKPKTPDIPKLPQLKSDDEDDELVAADLIEKPKEEPKPISPELSQEIATSPALPQVPLQPGQQPAAAQASGAQQAQAELKISDPKYAPIIVVSGGSGPALGVGYDKNIVSLGDSAIQKLDKSKVTVKTTFVDNRANVVAQGKLLTAVLETAINTEVPGSVRAIVSRDVYGEAGNEVLISRGSRLFGTYSSQIVRGQGRVQITWTRLIRPDGVDMAISSVASDQFGRAGIPGDVDNKYGSTITNSLLTSILAVSGVALAESLIGGSGSNTTTTNPQQGTTTTTGNASTQAVYNVSKTITDTVAKIVGENVNVIPAIRVPQGTRVTVIVNADMNIPSMAKK